MDSLAAESERRSSPVRWRDVHKPGKMFVLATMARHAG